MPVIPTNQGNSDGFIVIYPSVPRSSQCFDVSSPEALTRGGGSDPVGINSMVDHVLANHGADPDRVFITGHSSGGMMTNVMLGVYPDVFAAGAAFAGVPFGCFATDDRSGWNSQCANGQIDHTPQEWGTMVRNAYPGYNGGTGTQAPVEAIGIQGAGHTFMSSGTAVRVIKFFGLDEPADNAGD